jgi:hypothetical protein
MFIVGEHMGYIDFFSFKWALLINSLSEWCDYVFKCNKKHLLVAN